MSEIVETVKKVPKWAWGIGLAAAGAGYFLAGKSKHGGSTDDQTGVVASPIIFMRSGYGRKPKRPRRVVPELRGLTVTQARAAAIQAGFRGVVVIGTVRSRRPKGHIAGQQPRAGGHARKVWIAVAKSNGVNPHAKPTPQRKPTTDRRIGRPSIGQSPAHKAGAATARKGTTSSAPKVSQSPANAHVGYTPGRKRKRAGG